MAVNSVKTVEQLTDALRKHIESWGEEGKVKCIVYCPVGPWLVDSFCVDETGKPVVNVYPYTLEGGDHPTEAYSPEMFNRREFRAIIDGIEENADMLFYRQLCDRMNRSACLGEKEKRLKQRKLK